MARQEKLVLQRLGVVEQLPGVIAAVEEGCRVGDGVTGEKIGLV
jgi:hypothetical protein